ncbi:MAG TPA: glycosyltransferase family 2 protein [Gammaproteobacteria bacterium]|nr:glycosyltransferase family 2 protein [Gammaproteobacteria bacterium]
MDYVESECLSVVIPVYNEADHLNDRISRFVEVLDLLVDCVHWELHLVDNGSNDGTANIVDRLSEKNKNVFRHFLSRPNYGLAIRHGVEKANYTWIYIVDLDQWDDAFIRWSWEYRYDYDMIISSKRADPSLNQQSRVRFLLSWGLNAALQLLFAYPGSDTHGQKFLNRQSLNQILKETRADRGQYDVELVVRTLRSGKRVVELPVPYVEMRPSRNTLVKKVIWNFWALSKLAWRLRAIKYSSVELRRVSRSDVEAGRGFDHG